MKQQRLKVYQITSSSGISRWCKMVLPFGLSSDGQHNPDSISNVGSSGCESDAITSSRSAAYTPTAPPFFMRAHANVSTGIPIIPSPYIDFIVVNGDDRSMIRCERKAVLENSVELAKMIHAGPNSGRKGDNHFQISNVDKHDFELLIRFLETKFVRYRDHLHILKILELADRYNCPDLVCFISSIILLIFCRIAEEFKMLPFCFFFNTQIIHCIRELDLQLSSATVIDVFRSLWFYQGMTSNNQHQLGAAITTQDSSASKKVKRKAQLTATATNSAANFNSSSTPAPNLSPFTAEDYGVALLNNALQLIDMHAELILTKTEINELRFEELEMIVKRDALQLSSELTLFTCLADWSLAECKRKNLDATPENRQRVLGPLCLTPRYCLMSGSEFRKACDRLEILNPSETSLVSDCIEGELNSRSESD